MSEDFARKVVYQVYPKSFADSNGDGVGDLRGIIDHVDYIASLGVDVVWFNPFFPSPGNDNGYDVSDYKAIDPAMGTMADFEELCQRLAEHGIDVMLDMVLNHVSTEHEWFQRALAGDEHYQKFFYLRDPQPDGSLPTNWVSKFGGPAWAPFGDTGRYYLRLYDVSQADLDWHNPEVRWELIDVVNFWRSKGVHGFRFDVINVIGKPEVLEDAPAGVDDRSMYTDGPQVDEWLHELNINSFGQDPNHITVGEMSSTSIERCVGYSVPANQELDMVFSFHHLKTDYVDGRKWSIKEFDPRALKHVLNEWALGMQAGGGWNALFFNNHDQPRAINRFADPVNYHYESATALATIIHALRGTPYIYQGEEIGMTDPDYTSMESYVDVEAHNAYAELRERGLDGAEAFRIVHSKARDNSRTPMQWTPGPGAGFTTGTPWLAPTNQDTINVASGKPITDYYRELIALRKRSDAIAYGEYAPFELDHPHVYAFTRVAADERLLVAVNLSCAAQHLGGVAPAEQVLGNYDSVTFEDGGVVLQPYQATILPF